MARLRFPGRPGYRFDRIGVRYSADEARITTDPTLSIIASIHRGLQQFRDIFGDSDEDDTEFHGFTPAEVRAAERNFQRAIKQERQYLEQQAHQQKYRHERSKATLTCLAAAGLELTKNTRASINLRKTYKKIVETGLVQDAAHKIKAKPLQETSKPKSLHEVTRPRPPQPAAKLPVATGKQNGQPVPKNVSSLQHIKLKRLSHNVDTPPVFRRPVGRPRKYALPSDGTHDVQKSNSFESIAAASSVFGTKPLSKYTSMAKQILARATKHSAHASSKLFTTTHKVRKFVLPTKSSRSSRVIKPNKRFLEDDNVHQLVAKQAKITPASLTPVPAFKAPIFGMGVGSDKSNSFSAFPSCGLTMSPFNMTRDKGFPAFSTAPQPSGTSSFMDGLGNQKPLGSLDQPLIVEGKRPRKPSLIMRMKLVEDDPADEIRLQQQLSDSTAAVKSSLTPDGQKPLCDSKFSSAPLPSQARSFGAPKSLIAPAKLFTDSSTCSLSSKAFRAHYKHQQILSNLPSQSTVVLRQAKLQLNRTALNRSKAALARSLKAQLKREAKLERRRRTSQNRFGRLSVSDPSAVSPGSSLSQLSPFSKLASDSAIERQKSGLFEGIEAGAGSFSPGSFGSPPVTPSSLQTLKLKNEKVDNYQASLIKHEALLKTYAPGSRWHCLVCTGMCIIKKNRKLPQVPLCKSCKKAYFFQLTLKPGPLSKKKCKYGGRCSIHFSEKSLLHCASCKYRKFEAIMRKCKELGVGSYKMPKEERKEAITEEPYTPTSKQRHKSEEVATPESTLNKQRQGEFDMTPARQRQTHRSGDRMTEPGLRPPGRTSNHSSELISASNLDKPLSVDVDQDTDPFSLSPPQTLSSSKSTPDKGMRSPSRKLGLTVSDSDRVSEVDEDGHMGRSRASGRGPRIKHVCRRAAMVFPQQRATFPEEPQKRTLTLSALPNEEKRQLWAKNKQEQGEDSSTDESNDETQMPALASPDRKLLSPKDEKQIDVKKERKIGSNFTRKLAVHREERLDDLREVKMPRNKITEARTAATAVANRVKKKSMSNEKRVAARKKGYTRKIRCRECKGCKTPECGVCVFCRDKPKFGGPGRIKKCCIHSVCLAPKIPRKATQAFIEPKSPTKTYRRDDDDQNGDHHTRSHNSRPGFRESSSRYQEKRANNHWRVEGNGNGAKDDSEDVIEGPVEHMDTFQNGHSSSMSSSVQNGLDMDGSRFHSKTGTNPNSDRVIRYARGKYSSTVEATIQFALADVRNPFIGRMAEAFVGKMGHLKNREKILVPQKQLSVELKPVQNETAYSFDVPLKTHFIRADYEEAYDLDTAWSHGFSLTLTGPSCVRALCFLCGSAGKHEMLYCIVCCQPYHIFCLDENERPEYIDNEEEGDDGVDDIHSHHGSSNTVSWCCRRCQFCHVCGHQNGLLKCHRCKDTYHPECLGPNYPTRPSRKNIWVCTKCVRCKSCGATTPGVGTNATWTYDFSLCYECGKLMDKGNFCPICHKCYSDDDWESKMVQCAVCESWVHSKCEELTDEMYQLVSFLPEEVQYTCRVCSTESPPYWERVLKSELVNGLLNVLNGLMGSKCTQMLLESGPPKDSKKPRQARGKQSEWSRISEDSFSNENIVNTSVSSSTDSADSFLDISGDLFGSVNDTGQIPEKPNTMNTSGTIEHSVPSTTDNLSSNYTRHLLPRHDKEIVEKCDCETVQISSDSQTTEPNKDFSGRSLLFSDKLADPFNNAANGVREDNGRLQNPKANLASITAVDSQSATREILTPDISVPTVNGEGGPHSSKDSATDLFLGMVNKERNVRIIDSIKLTPTMNGDMDCPVGVGMTRLTNCDTTNCANVPCSAAVSAASFSSSKTLSGGTVHVNSLPSPLYADDPSHLQVMGAQPHGSLTPAACGVTVAESAIPAASFYSNPCRESVTKNLFLNHNSGGSCTMTFQGDCMSKCALRVEKDGSVHLPAKSNREIVSLNGSLKCVEDILPRMDAGSGEDNAALVRAGVDDLQQQQIGPAAAAAHEDMTGRLMAIEQDKTPEKLATVVRGPACDLHVRFGHSVRESWSQSGDFPTDFNSIKLKIDSGSYTTVEEFSEDVVRIIQSLLFENELYTTRKKQANSVRSIFIKHMERFFPWFNVNTCKLWDHNRKLPAGMLKDAVLPPSTDHTYAQWLERKDVPMTPQPSPFKRVGYPQRMITMDGSSSEVCSAEKIQHHLVQSEDSRACLLCQQFGDDEPDLAGRLLYCGQDDWVHINCALWSAEVFEQDDGSLQNVLEAVSRGKKLRCNLCQQPGATVGCCEANCRANYHFMCARADRCSFQDDKTVFCQQHADCVIRKVIREGHFDISSRACVNFDKIRAKSSWGKAVNPATLNVIIGSCTVESLGVLQSSLSDTEECLYPVDFRCTRIYWSTQDARRRCVYTCRIVKVEPDVDSPSIQIQDLRVVHDERHADYIPLDQLHLEQLGIPNFLKTGSKSCGLAGDQVDDVVCLGSDSVTVTVTTVSFSSQSVNAASVTRVSNSTAVLSETRSSSLQSVQNPVLHSDNPEHCFIIDEDDPHGVTKSWPMKAPKQKPKAPEPQPIDLSGLSPSTLALLSIKDPSKYIVPSTPFDTSRSLANVAYSVRNLPARDEEFGLVKFADRLNNAASSGRSKPLNTDAGRSTLMSPTFPRVSCLQQPYNQLLRQTHHSESQSPSPVSFSPRMRSRSSSEERYSRPYSPLSYAQGSAFPASSSSVTSPTQLNRARSVSPFTVIKPQVLMPRDLRSSSLSPPFLAIHAGHNVQARETTSSLSSAQTSLALQDNYRMETDDVCHMKTLKSRSVTPIAEIFENEDEENIIAEDANRKSNLDPNLHSENLEVSNTDIHQSSASSPAMENVSGLVEEQLCDPEMTIENTDVTTGLGSEILSTENLQSILESVPSDVLEGDDVKVVVLTDIEDLSEEDIMKLATAVLQESAVTAGGEEEAGNGEVGDSDGQKGEEATQNRGSDDADSREGNQGDAEHDADINGDHDAPDCAGSASVSNGDTLKGSEPAQSTSEDTVKGGEAGQSTSEDNTLSTDPTPFGHSSSASAGSFSSRGNSQDNGDDDDLRKPHKNAENKKKEDVVFVDLDNDKLKKDSIEAAIESEKSFTGQVVCCSPKSHSDCLAGANVHAVNVDERGDAHVRTTSDPTNETDTSLCALDKTIESNTFDSETENPFSLNKSSGENHGEGSLFTSSTVCVLDDSPAETHDTANHSFTDVSEDDVKIIDLSDSEQAVAFSPAKAVNITSGNNVLRATYVGNTEIVQQGRVDNVANESCILGHENNKSTCVNNSTADVVNIPENVNTTTDQLLNSTVNISVLKIDNSSLAKSSSSSVKCGSQSRMEAGPKVIAGTRDTTTDEDSDYLMLDDLTYSETNEDDDCNDGERSARPDVVSCVDPAQSDIACKDRQTVDTRSVRNKALNIQDTVLLENSTNSSLPKKSEEQRLHSDVPQVSVMSERKNQKTGMWNTGSVGQLTSSDKCATNTRSNSNALKDFGCAEGKATKAHAEKLSDSPQIKLKPCFVALRKEDAVGKCKSEISSCGRRGASGGCVLAPKSVQLRSRKLSGKVNSCGDTSHTSLMEGFQDHAGSKVEDATAGVNLDVSDGASHEELKVGDGKVDICKHAEDCSVSEMHHQMAADEQDSHGRAHVLQQSKECVQELKEIKTNRNEAELVGTHNINVNASSQKQTSNNSREKRGDRLGNYDVQSDGAHYGNHVAIDGLDDRCQETAVLSTTVNSHNEDLAAVVSLLELGTSDPADSVETAEGVEKDVIDIYKRDLSKKMETPISKDSLLLNSYTTDDSVGDDLSIQTDQGGNRDHAGRVTSVFSNEKQYTSNTEYDHKDDVENMDVNVEHESSTSGNLNSNKKTTQKSADVLSASKSCEERVEFSSGEDEKELAKKDKTSAPPDTPVSSTRDKNLFHSVVPRRDGLESGSDDSLHERIVEKIKAESLARSSPGKEGPFKCPTCKRIYRTRESYEFHVRDCDFEVSTSDEDDKPSVKDLCSDKRSREESEHLTQGVSSDVEKLKSLSSSSPSPLNEPLTIIITDEYKDEKFSPSSRDLSDDCSSVQSQDSRRSSLRKSTMTQRNAAPAHLAKVRSKDSKLSMSPDGSSCSSLLSPKSCTSRVEEKPSPKETMLEAVGLISRRSLELSPNSDIDGSASALNKTLRLQPRVSPTAMTVAPKREKRSPAHAGAGGLMRPSIMAGGLPKPGSSTVKSVAITYDPVIVDDVKLEPLKPKRPRQKRIWWVEASECPEGTVKEHEEAMVEREEEEEDSDEEDSDEEESVACRTRQRSSELKSPPLKKGTRATAQSTLDKSDESIVTMLTDSKDRTSDVPGTQNPDTAVTCTSEESTTRVDASQVNPHSDCSLRKSDVKPKKLEIKSSPAPGLPKLRSSRRLSLAHGDSQDKAEAKHPEEVTKSETDLCQESSTNETKKPSDNKAISESHSLSQILDIGHSSFGADSSQNLKLSQSNVRVTRSKERRGKDNKNEEIVEDPLLTEDPLMSLRRSRRPASKTAKLSHYLTELKKDKDVVTKEEIKSQNEMPAEVTLSDISLKRGRSRLRACAEKDTPRSVEINHNGRSRLRSRSESGTKSEATGGNTVLNLMDNKNTQLADEMSESPLLKSEPDRKCLQRLQDSQRKGTGNRSFINNDEHEILHEDGPEAKLSTDEVQAEKDATNMDEVRQMDLSSVDLENACHTTRDKLSDQSSEDRKHGAAEALIKTTNSGIHRTEDHDVVTVEPPPAEDMVECCHPRNEIDHIFDTKTEAAQMDTSKDEPSESPASPETSEELVTSPETSEELVTKNDSLNSESCLKSAPDKLKPSGQKLRIIIRSPNVAAAQTIGELIRKTAMTVNPNTLDVTVTTTDTSVSQAKEHAAEKVSCSESICSAATDQPAEPCDASQKDEVDHLLSADAQESTEDVRSKDDASLVSRSGSPDSMSAAYDIQSDDFSSETSNDMDDYPPRIPSSGESTPQVSSAPVTGIASNLPSSNTQPSIVDVNNQKSDLNDEDDDVVIVKAVGLQPPEPGLAFKISQALASHSQAQLALSSTYSHQYSTTPGMNTNTSSTVAVTSCGRILSTPSVLQQGATLPHLSQQPLTVSPTRQSMHPFMNLHHRTSPQQNQPAVMISEVSPGRFIFQQQTNSRPEFLPSHDISQSGFMLQSPGQTGIIIQTPNQPGITLQNPSQPGIIFRHAASTGMMLPPGNPTAILQSTGQSSLPFFSLNPANPLASTIISPLQQLQPHVNSPSVLPSNMGLAPLMQAASLGSQSLMIGQPFIAQPGPGMFLPQVSTQPMVPQHSDHIDVTHRQHQQQLQSPLGHHSQQQQHVKPSSIIIDPHAHMLSSGLNQTLLKASMQQYSSLKQKSAGVTSGFGQEALPPQLITQSAATSQLHSTAPVSFSSSSTVFASQTLKTYPTVSTLAPALNLPTTTKLAVPKLTKVDGAPAQVSYMGSFDLNSSSLQSVMSSGQNFNQDASKRIVELVQSALKNQGKGHIPGVEVTTAITNTPQGPKKVLRVFINEDILPSDKSATRMEVPGIGTSVLSTTSSAAASLLSLAQASNAAASQTDVETEWTKLLPSSSQGHRSPQPQQSPNLWTSSNSGFVSIPIRPSLSAASRSSQPAGNARSLSSAQFRRALKPGVYSQQSKRKLAQSSVVSEGPQAKRPVFEKLLKNDGVFTGTLQQIVERHAYISDSMSCQTSSADPVSSHTYSGHSQPFDSGCHRDAMLSNSAVPSSSFTGYAHEDQPATDSISGDHIHPPATSANDPTSDSAQQESQLHHLQQHPYHHITQQQLQQSPHKRASFPLVSPARKPQATAAAAALSQSSRAHVRKQILHKSMVKKDKLQKSDKEVRRLTDNRKAGVRPRRHKTDVKFQYQSYIPDYFLSSEKGSRALQHHSSHDALVASHHPLIHHKKGVDSLPQPTLEEEVVATPLDLGKGEHPHGAGAKCDRERSQSRLKFEITSDDGFSCQGDTVEDAWNQVLERVQDVRAASRMKQLSYAGISGRTMFGLDHDAVVYLIEQLYGALQCHRNYKFRFHKYDLDQADEEVALNPSGAARSESFASRKPFDMFNFLKSVYRTKPGDDEREKEEEMALKSSRRATSLSLPMAMRFRKLKTFAKEAVDVYRSKIHGRGLFCKRNIDAGEMVIEYAGEVIRASLTDKREKYYESKGIGCYMFRIDDDEVVDATMHGSAARFINHSCEPNCFSKVILVDGKKHIVIFAMRPIKRGEELTYDYKFPIEEVKIPCSCGSKRCRKYLN